MSDKPVLGAFLVTVSDDDRVQRRIVFFHAIKLIHGDLPNGCLFEMMNGDYLHVLETFDALLDAASA